LGCRCAMWEWYFDSGSFSVACCSVDCICHACIELYHLCLCSWNTSSNIASLILSMGYFNLIRK
jgi:hypothetical protein